MNWNGYQILAEYLNKIVRVDFKDNCVAFNEYGSNVIGFFYLPIEQKSSFYEDVKISAEVTYQHQLVRIGFKLTPGFKLKNGISDEIENKLLDQGFKFDDILNIIPYDDFILEVSGNIESYLHHQKIKFQSFIVNGIIGPKLLSSNLTFTKSGYTSHPISYNDFYSFCDQIRGCQYDQINNILKSFNISFLLDTPNLFELDLIKALCNIFIWFEYYFTDIDALENTNNIIHNEENLPQIFNDFITDYTQNEGSQRDIFFLKRSSLNAHTSLSALNEKLFEHNLLSKLNLRIGYHNFENYFVPFLKARHNLSINDKLYQYYSNILNDRNICLTNFSNR